MRSTPVGFSPARASRTPSASRRARSRDGGPGPTRSAACRRPTRPWSRVRPGRPGWRPGRPGRSGGPPHVARPTQPTLPPAPPLASDSDSGPGRWAASGSRPGRRPCAATGSGSTAAGASIGNSSGVAAAHPWPFRTTSIRGTGAGPARPCGKSAVRPAAGRAGRPAVGRGPAVRRLALRNTNRGGLADGPDPALGKPVPGPGRRGRCRSGRPGEFHTPTRSAATGSLVTDWGRPPGVSEKTYSGPQPHRSVCRAESGGRHGVRSAPAAARRGGSPVAGRRGTRSTRPAPIE